MKGIAEASASQLLGELLTMTDNLTVTQWVAYAGLDPRHFESGSSIAKKTRISKAGTGISAKPYTYLRWWQAAASLMLLLTTNICRKNAGY